MIRIIDVQTGEVREPMEVVNGVQRTADQIYKTAQRAIREVVKCHQQMITSGLSINPHQIFIDCDDAVTKQKLERYLAKVAAR